MFLRVKFIPISIIIVLKGFTLIVKGLLSVHWFKPIKLKELVLHIGLQLLFRKYILLHIMSTELFWNYVGILLHYLLIMIEIIAKNTAVAVVPTLKQLEIF